MKKIIFSLLAITSFFLVSDRVNALSIVNDNASFSDVYFYSGETSSNTYISTPNTSFGSGFGLTSFQNAHLYHPFYGGPGSNIWFNSGIQWSNKDWCKGSDITFEGYLVPQVQESSRQMFSNSNYWNLNLEIPEDNISNICSISSTTILSLNEQIPVLKFICSAKSGSLTRSYKFLLSQGSQQFNGSGYWGIQKGSFSYSCDISTNDIINNQNNNTNQIIGSAAQNTTDIINNQVQNKNDILNNQNNNTNQIIGSAAQNTTDIINNQIKNNEELKNTINDNFQNCRDSKNLLNMPYFENNKFTYTATKDDDYKSTDFYLYLEAGKKYTFSVETSGTFGNRNDDTEIYLLFDKKYDYIIHMDSKNGYTFTPTRSGKYYIRYDVNKKGDTQSFWNFQIVEGTQNIPFEKFGEEICSNKIDETNNQLNDLNQNITDSTPPDLGNLDSSAGWLPAGPVDSIINLPLSFMQNLSNSLSKQCKPIELDIPFLPENQKMILPCMTTIYEQIPNFNALWNWLGITASAFILFKYLLSLYKWVDDTLSFRENTWQDWGGV